jgi:MEDS: MEthanogen/methylotroph, DcmR Sensory domain
MIRDVRPAPTHDHLCCAYADPTVFDRTVVDFLAAGLAAGQQVWYVADRPPAEPPDGFRGPAYRYVPTAAVYPADGVLDPHRQARTFFEALRRALAEGYTGLRVAADTTPLARTGEQLDAYLRYEYLVDSHMVAAPIAGMCGFDRAALTASALASIACLHPQSNTGDEVLFRLYAGPESMVLTGELDPTGRDVFAGVLDRVEPPVVHGEITLDATALTYVDHRALMSLEEYAARRDAIAVLRTPLTAAARLVELLGLSRVRVEATA